LIQGYTVNIIHYTNVILIGIVAITLRECRLGGYKLCDCYTRWI